MNGQKRWSRGRTAILVGAIAVATLGTTVPYGVVPVVEASVVQGKDSVVQGKDRNDKQDKDKKKRDRDDEADRVAEGQVLGIDTEKDPPELVIGTADGDMVVRMLKTDEIAINDVHVGDYVTLDGEKINELLFEAQQLTVSERYSAPSGDGEDDGGDSKDKKKKKK